MKMNEEQTHDVIQMYWQRLNSNIDWIACSSSLSISVGIENVFWTFTWYIWNIPSTNQAVTVTLRPEAFAYQKTFRVFWNEFGVKKTFANRQNPRNSDYEKNIWVLLI